MSSLWLSIEPSSSALSLLLSAPRVGTSLKARLPPRPAHPRALALTLEALASWYGLPLTAVLDADAEDVRRSPLEWAHLLGDLASPQIAVEWVGRARPALRDSFFAGLGNSRAARQRVSQTATGQR
jgi:hypothetical protein